MSDLYANRYRVDSARLASWDYSNPGWYFVTFCTRNRRQCLSTISEGEVRLTSIGEIVREEWTRTPLVRPEAALGSFVVMPDHLHGLIYLKDGAKALGIAINQVKSIATKRIRAAIDPDFRWQARFYDRIVRDLDELVRIDDYIRANPGAWKSRPMALEPNPDRRAIPNGSGPIP